MATLIEANNCSYEEFDELRHKLIQANRFGLMNAEYIKEHLYARFWVHDVKYIPVEFYLDRVLGIEDNLTINVHIPADFRVNFVLPAVEKYEQE